jgi:hypothetical protein
MGNVAT